MISEMNVQKMFDNMINESIGLKIHGRREELGLSLDDVACALGISSDKLASYEYGIHEFYPDMLYGLSKVLDTNINYFFEEINQIKN